jgi:hypothetical protein
MEGPWTIALSITAILGFMLAIGDRLWRVKRNGTGPGTATHESQKEIVSELQAQTACIRDLCDSMNSHEKACKDRHEELTNSNHQR